MSERTPPSKAPGTPWLRWPLAVAGLIAVASAFFLAAATTLRLRDGAGATGFPASMVRRTLELFGFESTFMVAALLMVWCSVWFFTGRFERPVGRLLRIAGLGFCLAVLVGMRADGHAGGEIGAAIAARLTSLAFVPQGLVAVVVGVAVIAALLLATDFFFFGHFKRLADRAAAGAAELHSAPQEASVESTTSSAMQAVAAAPEHAAEADPSPVEEPDGVEQAAVAELAELRLAVHEKEPVEAAPAGAEAENVGFEADAWNEVVPPADAPAATTSRRERRRATRAAAAASDEVAARELEGGDAWAEFSAAEVAPIEAEAEALAASETPGPESATPLREETLPAPGSWFHTLEFEARPTTADREVDATDLGTEPVEEEVDPLDEFEFAIPSPPVAAVDLPVEDRAPVEEEVDVRAGAELVEAAVDALAPPAADAEEPGEGRARLDEPAAEAPSPGAESADGGPGDDEPADEQPADEQPAEQATAAGPVVVLHPAERGGGVKQKGLFGSAAADESLFAEARELVVTFRRASTNFLKRRLRVSEQEATELMQELARRGVIECDEDAAHGRVLVDR